MFSLTVKDVFHFLPSSSTVSHDFTRDHQSTLRAEANVQIEAQLTEGLPEYHFALTGERGNIGASAYGLPFGGKEEMFSEGALRRTLMLMTYKST